MKARDVCALLAVVLAPAVARADAGVGRASSRLGPGGYSRGDYGMVTWAAASSARPDGTIVVAYPTGGSSVAVVEWDLADRRVVRRTTLPGDGEGGVAIARRDDGLAVVQSSKSGESRLTLLDAGFRVTTRKKGPAGTSPSIVTGLGAIFVATIHAGDVELASFDAGDGSPRAKHEIHPPAPAKHVTLATSSSRLVAAVSCSGPSLLASESASLEDEITRVDPDSFDVAAVGDGAVVHLVARDARASGEVFEVALDDALQRSKERRFGSMEENAPMTAAFSADHALALPDGEIVRADGTIERHATRSPAVVALAFQGEHLVALETGEKAPALAIEVLR